MTTPDSQIIKERIAALKAQQPSFTTPDGQPMPSIPIQPKPAQFRKAGLLQQAKELSLSDDAKAIDELVDSLPMQEAVNLWGKPQTDFKRVGGSTVLIRCPKPEHPDNNPSASCDLEQGLWHCHGCQEGGDKYALAALHHGIPDYQSGKNFVDLKHKIAADLGYTITETAGTTTLTPPATPQVLQPVDLNAVNPAPPAPAVQPLQQLDDGTWYDPATGEVTTPAPTPQPAIQPVSFDDIEVEEQVSIQPKLDWIPAGKNRSFIDRYMECTMKKGYPDSFAFAGALVCLGFVGNRSVKLINEDPLHSGMGILTIAGTGVGKSRAMRDAQKILSYVMPWKDAEIALMTGGHIVPGSGVKAIPGAGSGENVIKQFEDYVEVPDGTNADGSTHYVKEHQPVNGLVSFEELSQLVGKASATGSTLRERIMNFLDGAHLVENSTNTQGTYKAVDPFAFIYTSVQPRMVNKLITENDEHSGFLNRFAIFTGERKTRDPRNMKQIPLDPAIDALKELKAHWDSVGDAIITYDAAGLERMATYIENESDPQQLSGNGLLSRLDILLWKLILLLCINECTTVVTEDIVGKAIHLHRYFIETYKYATGEMYTSEGSDAVSHNEDRVTERIRKVIKAKKEKGAQHPAEYGVSAREIHQGTRRHLNLEQLNRLLKQMVEIGALTSTQAGRKIVYTFNE